MAAGALAKYAAAGGIGACVSHAGAVPLDVIKTRVQLEPEKFSGGGVVDNARTLVAEEGWGVLLRGLGSTMAGFTVHGALKYGGFEGIKYAIFNAGGPIAAFAVDHRLPALLLAAALAETVASLGLCPLEQARIKMVSDAEYASNFAAATARLFADEGVDGVFRSLPPIYAKMIPFSMFQLAMYDVTSGALRDVVASSHVALSPLAAQIPASFVAAFTASLASQPGDTLLSTMNKGRTREMLEAGEPPCITDACSTGDLDAAVAVGDSLDWLEGAGAAGSAGSAAAATAVDEPVAAKAAERRGEGGAVVGSKAEPVAAMGVVETALALGPAGLFTGWRERLVHVSTVIVIQLLCYDNIKAALLK